MEVNAFNALIKSRIDDLDRVIIKIIYPPATAIHNQMLERLFDEGVNGSGKKIGTYSTSESYFTKKQFKKTGSFKGRGKNSDKPFKNGNQRGSMYFSDGYKGLRSAQGYESAFVNLQYSKDLRNDFATKLTATKNAVQVRLAREINRDKVKWLSDKYGPELFKHTRDEIEFFTVESTKRLIDYLVTGKV